MFVKRVEELRIYQIAVRLRNEVHKEVRKIPKYWAIEDAKQILESSSSVPSNITEGFGKRFYPKDHIRFLNIALASNDETKNHALALGEDNRITKEKADYFYRSYKDLSIKILNFINHQKKRHNIRL